MAKPAESAFEKALERQRKWKEVGVSAKSNRKYGDNSSQLAEIASLLRQILDRLPPKK